MKKNIILVVFLTATLGCVAATGAQADGCPNLASLKLTVDQYHLDLNDKRPICVTSPGTFKIVIHQPGNSTVTVGAGDVTVSAKETTGVTIDGNNNAPLNKITVNVGAGGLPDDEFAFLIDVKGVGVLDPKVRVIPSSQLMKLRSDTFYDVLDTLGLTLEDTNKLAPPQGEAE
ncbi:MAG: hypothetical protein HQ492_07500 [Woeseiaceae bacterium]|nr:hypothetical protein [Woeseiaceae bacterium]